MKQKCFQGEDAYFDFIQMIRRYGKKVFVVSGKFCQKLPIVKRITNALDTVVFFSDFSPNPTYESVENGVELFRRCTCDSILAIGGGSAMDVAKCIKLFATMSPDSNYLKQPFIANDIFLAAVPTTAGTGSEATRFAVIYYKGEKQSVTHESLIPQGTLLDADLLTGLPEYQKKATMLDALCHATESFWSLHSTNESKKYAKEAIQLIFANKTAYLRNDPIGNKNMLWAAHLAGKAINISQTTAAHAMCYKLTSLYGLAHGHAAAIVLPKLWRYMLEHEEQCVDSRGASYLSDIFDEIAAAMECDTVAKAIEQWEKLLKELSLSKPKARKEDRELLVSSVNVTRLKNNPVSLNPDDIDKIYGELL